MAEIKFEVPDKWLEKPLSRKMSYCVTAWVAFQALKIFWRLVSDPNNFFVRAISRILYSCSFSDRDKGIKSGLTSNLNPSDDVIMTNDHFLPPELAGTFVMDNPEKYLDNFDNFFGVYKASQYTHEVERTQNKALSKSKSWIPKIFSYRDLSLAPTTDKEKIPNGIKLYDKQTQKEVSNLIAPMVKVTDDFLFDLCTWEHERIIDKDSEFGMPKLKNIKEAEEINLNRRNSLQPITTLEEFYEED